MTAFKYKDTFTTGGGECVSLSALYAAAMFIVGRVPLDRIFLIATPLHSQNFIIEKEGPYNKQQEDCYQEYVVQWDLSFRKSKKSPGK